MANNTEFETFHPRASAGKFTDKKQSAPDSAVTLDANDEDPLP